MEKKKKGKGIVITIIIVIVLLAGGYFAYNSIFEHGSNENLNVEVKEIGNIQMDGAMLSDEDSIKVIELMNEAEATYFKVENGDKKAIVSQINKDDFDAIGSMTSNKANNFIKNGVKSFLNTKYDKLPSNLYETDQNNNTTIFGKVYCDGIEDDLKKCFGMETEKLFKKYKLSISCKEVEVKKMAVYDTGEMSIITGVGSESMETEWINYYFIVNAKVKTEEAKEGVSKTSCFAEKGETQNINILLGTTSDNWFKDLTINSLMIRN